MKIHLNVEIRRGGASGVEARCPDIGLTSHGPADEDAVASLKRSIEAWADGLQRKAMLVGALKRKGISWDSDGASVSLDLDIAVQPPYEPQGEEDADTG